MKHFLLTLATLLVASFVYAQSSDEDITPSKYKYANREVGQEVISQFFTGANIPSPSDKLLEEKYDNGLFVVAGGQFGNSAQPYAKDLQAGVSIVDLGGEVGKVLCINGVNSKFNEKFKVNFPKCTGGLNWFNFNWYMDPQNTPQDGSAENMNIRVRVVMNIYANQFSETAPIIDKAYMVTNQGNVIPDASNSADGNAVMTGDFIQRYEDDDSPVLDDDENYIYDANKWMVYEWDTYCPGPDKNDPSKLGAPLRLKMEMKPGELAGATLFIKEVSFTKLASNPDPIKGRRKTMKTIEMKPSDVKAVNTVKPDIDNRGKEAYTLSGVKVSTDRNLPHGVYVIKENGTTRKMLIK